MATSSSGAVFFLGTRAHYQVLDQPESKFDAENGNASTENIYQNASTVQELWPRRQTNIQSEDAGDRKNWNYEKIESAASEIDRQEPGVGVKRRTKRRSSEAALCEDEMRPAVLNSIGERDEAPKSKSSRRISLLSFLTSLARRKRRLDSDQVQYLRHLESALTTCTYRESCRCLECQSRYFDCDESSENYSSDESEYIPRYAIQAETFADEIEDSDDEVFKNSVPEDNASTDLLIEGKEKMSVSSDAIDDNDEEASLQLEVAAGTPVLLNYLLTHPITCTIM